MPARDRGAGRARPLRLFPRQIDGWSGSAATLRAERRARSLGADDYLSASTAARTRRRRSTSSCPTTSARPTGAPIHSPEVCLPGAGWEVSAIEPVTVALPGTRFGAVTLNRAVIQKGLERQLVYYWFEGRGRRITNDFAAASPTSPTP